MTRRYQLLDGDAFWITDRRNPERGVLFRLKGNDGKHARTLLRNLNEVDVRKAIEAREAVMS